MYIFNKMFSELRLAYTTTLELPRRVCETFSATPSSDTDGILEIQKSAKEDSSGSVGSNDINSESDSESNIIQNFGYEYDFNNNSESISGSIGSSTETTSNKILIQNGYEYDFNNNSESIFGSIDSSAETTSNKIIVQNYYYDFNVQRYF